jgi:hypothetical protein
VLFVTKVVNILKSTFSDSHKHHIAKKIFVDPYIENDLKIHDLREKVKI